MPPRKGKNKSTAAKASASAPKNKQDKPKEPKLIDLSDNPSPTSSESDTDASEGQEEKRPATARRAPQNTPRKKPRTTAENNMEEDFAVPSSSTVPPKSIPKTATHSANNAQPSHDDHSGAAHNAQNGNSPPNNISDLTQPPVTPEIQNKEQPHDQHVSRHANKDDTVIDDASQNAAIIADSLYYKAAAPITDLIQDKESKKQCLGRIADYCIDRYESFYRVTALEITRKVLSSFSLKMKLILKRLLVLRTKTLLLTKKKIFHNSLNTILRQS